MSLAPNPWYHAASARRRSADPDAPQVVVHSAIESGLAEALRTTDPARDQGSVREHEFLLKHKADPLNFLDHTLFALARSYWSGIQTRHAGRSLEPQITERRARELVRTVRAGDVGNSPEDIAEREKILRLMHVKFGDEPVTGTGQLALIGPRDIYGRLLQLTCDREEYRASLERKRVQMSVEHVNLHDFEFFEERLIWGAQTLVDLHPEEAGTRLTLRLPSMTFLLAMAQYTSERVKKSEPHLRSHPRVRRQVAAEFYSPEFDLTKHAKMMEFDATERQAKQKKEKSPELWKKRALYEGLFAVPVYLRAEEGRPHPFVRTMKGFERYVKFVTLNNSPSRAGMRALAQRLRTGKL